MKTFKNVSLISFLRNDCPRKSFLISYYFNSGLVIVLKEVWPTTLQLEKMLLTFENKILRDMWPSF